MKFIAKIYSFIKNLLPGKYMIEKRYIVESIDYAKLKNYGNSLGWFLDRIAVEGKVPANIMHISTVGNTEKELLVYYDERGCEEKEVIKFLLSCGIRVRAK